MGFLLKKPVNGYTANIDASDTAEWNESGTDTSVLEGFKPIGDSNYEFQGYFDGDGYKISGLHINRPGTSDVGLFGRVSYPAHIRNVSLEGGSILGSGNVGGLAGYLMPYGELLHCDASCAVSAGGGNAGGLVGYSDAGYVENCYATGNAAASVDNAGGLIGFADDGWVGDSSASGDVTAGGDSAGGLIGRVGYGTSVEYCFTNIGAVTADGSYAGGLIGYDAGYGLVSRSYSRGAVTNGTSVGGLVGYTAGNSTCYYSYWDTQASGRSSSAMGTGMTTENMKLCDTYENWVFNDVLGYGWSSLCDGSGYPELLDVNSTIDQQSSGVVAGLWSTVEFSVMATSASEISYQWTKDGADLSDGGRISGATTSTLQIADVDVVDEGSYACRVSNDYGDIKSDAAMLMVTVSGILTNADFEADANGNPPTGWTTYLQSGMYGNWTLQTVSPPEGSQWQQTQVYNTGAYGGVLQSVSGLTSGVVYTIAGSYRTNSVSATAAVRYNLGGDTDPANSTVLVSKTDTNWGAFAGAVTASGTSLTLFLEHINGTSENKASAYDNIVVTCVPVVGQQPATQAVCSGATVEFVITATGQGTLEYQWQKNGETLSDGGHYSGCTTATLTVTGADTNDEANYSCVVTGDCGTAVSNPAGLLLEFVANGNFEADTAANPPSGWTTYLQANKSGNWTIQTYAPAEGTQYQQTQVYNNSCWGGVRQNVAGLANGTVYTISGSYRTNSGTATASVRYNLSGGTDRGDSSILVSTSSTNWGTFNQAVTATGGTMTLFLDHINGTASNKAAAFDNVKITCGQ